MFATVCLIYIGHLLGITSWVYWAMLAFAGACQLFNLGSCLYKLGKESGKQQ